MSKLTEYDKNITAQYESLGRFVEAFERMVNEVRSSCIDLIALDASKRIKRMAEIAFYHQSLTAKPLFEMFRAMMMETVTDPDFRNKHQVTDQDCDHFVGVFTTLGIEYNELGNKRNNLLHGTWFIGYPSEEDEHSSTFYVHKAVVTKNGLSSIDLPETAAQLGQLTARCDEARDWISRLYSCVPTHPMYLRITKSFKRTNDKWEFVWRWQESPVGVSRREARD